MTCATWSCACSPKKPQGRPASASALAAELRLYLATPASRRQPGELRTRIDRLDKCRPRSRQPLTGTGSPPARRGHRVAAGSLAGHRIAATVRRSGDGGPGWRGFLARHCRAAPPRAARCPGSPAATALPLLRCRPGCCPGRGRADPAGPGCRRRPGPGVPAVPHRGGTQRRDRLAALGAGVAAVPADPDGDLHAAGRPGPVRRARPGCATRCWASPRCALPRRVAGVRPCRRRARRSWRHARPSRCSPGPPPPCQPAASFRAPSNERQPPGRYTAWAVERRFRFRRIYFS